MNDSIFPDKLKIYVTRSGNRVYCEVAHFDHPEACDYIRADLVSTWMPIDTAPMDGTEIDVWCASDVPGDNDGFRVANAWWCRVDKKWRTAMDGRITWMHQPTRWMPIPK